MFMIRVEFPNLTCGLDADIEQVPNVEFIPLEISILVPRRIAALFRTPLCVATDHWRSPCKSWISISAAEASWR